MADDSGVWVKIVPDDFNLSGAAGAAVIDSVTGAVTTSSFTGDVSIPGTEPGQAYDVYEFLGSGTMNVIEPGLVDAVVVAGGGGGGNNQGGGGGAGGFVDLPEVYLSEAPDLPAVVGAGGNNGDGNTSYLSVYDRAIGGGAGGGRPGGVLTAGSDGGSSGGGCTGKGTGQARAGQGHIGGGGGANPSGKTGGGGGAGNQAIYENGGVAKETFITGESVFLAGGGGGGNTQGQSNQGVGGSGIGGDGGFNNSKPSTAGAENTGSGGGGGGSDGATAFQGNKGGKGIVIVRVKVPTMSYSLRTTATAPKTAHAARIEDGIVRQVIAIPHLDDDDQKITEYCNSIGLPGTWVDTSYTGSRRGKYAGVGDLFDLNTRNAEFTSPVEETE